MSIQNPFESFFEDAAHTIGDTVNAAGNVANDAAKVAVGTALQVANAVESTTNQVATGVTEVASGIADTVAPVTDEAMKVASGAASAVMEGALQAAADTASTIASAFEGGVAFVKENSFAARMKRARIDGFKDGINQGAYLAGQKRYNFYYAYVATLCFFLRSDGEFSEEERLWLEEGMNHLKLEGGLPDEVKERLYVIAGNEDLSFDDVEKLLDDVSLVSLDAIVDNVALAIEIDDDVTEDELMAREMLSRYVETRVNSVCEQDDSWSEKAIEESVAEYGENYDRINEEFKDKTKLQGPDLAFLTLATMLQVMRVVVINALTQVENAGNGNPKEKVLHGFQEKLFNKIGADERVSSGTLYASMHHILSTPSVPYDVTNTGGRLQGLFKGANHRFSTLGHDPALGLIFGTSNIMTNTITCVSNNGLFGTGFGIPTTYTVDYTDGAPLISDPVGTIEMLIKSVRRVGEEPKAAAAALIKQVIHIGTDLYTPFGIQLPLGNIVLDKKHVGLLTKYVGTGDVLKVGTQAGMTLLINWLIAAIHGSSLIFKDDSEVFSMETYQVRTKKIILISDTLATSSSIIQAAVMNEARCLDIGGAAILVYRLFSDLSFISKVREDYVNSGLNDIYEERAKGILF